MQLAFSARTLFLLGIIIQIFISSTCIADETTVVAAQLNTPNEVESTEVGIVQTSVPSAEEQRKHVKNVLENDKPQKVIIAFEANSHQANSDAQNLLEIIPRDIEVSLLAVDSADAVKAAEIATITEPSSKNFLDKLRDRIVKPTQLERSVATFMTSYRGATTVPIIYVGFSEHFGIAAASGLAISMMMTSRTYIGTTFRETFDRIYSGYNPATGERKLSKPWELALRAGVDLFFFQALGYLSSVLNNTSMDQPKMLALWGIQTVLGNLFQIARSSTFKSNGSNAEVMRERSSIASFNFWLLSSPWSLLELVGYSPKVLNIYVTDLSASHFALAATTLASVLLIKKEWYAKFLDFERNFILNTSKIIQSAFKMHFNIPKVWSWCKITEAKLDTQPFNESSVVFLENTATGL